MIQINHKNFEKTSGASLKFLYKFVSDLIGPIEKTVAKDRATTFARKKTQEKFDNDRV